MGRLKGSTNRPKQTPEPVSLYDVIEEVTRSLIMPTTSERKQLANPALQAKINRLHGSALVALSKAGLLEIK